MPTSLPHPPDSALLHMMHVLLETRSVSRAAEQLGVSQPSLSRALARLRRLFDDPILVRSGGGMILTPRAENLRSPLAAWLAQGSTLIRPETFDPARLRRRFALASSDYGVLAVIEPALSRVMESAPGAVLDIDALAGGSSRRLMEGSLDLVITGFPPQDGLHSRFLFTERHMCLVRPGHPLLDAPITPDRWSAWPHLAISIGQDIGDPIHSGLPKDVRRRIAISTVDFSISPFLVAATDAIVTLPQRAAYRFAILHGLAIFEPPASIPPFNYWLVWHERSRRDAATQWLIQTLACAFET